MIISNEELANLYEEQEDYAKRQAIAFYEFKRTWQLIEGINFRHENKTIFDNRDPTWVGASDDVIWGRFKNGGQLERHYETIKP